MFGNNIERDKDAWWQDDIKTFSFCISYHGCEEIYSKGNNTTEEYSSMNHRKFWHKWEAHLSQPPKKSGLSHLLFCQVVLSFDQPSRQVASLKAVIHFSARLSFSEQKTILSCPGWVSRNTRPAGSPSYSSKFFWKIKTHHSLFRDSVIGEVTFYVKT